MPQQYEKGSEKPPPLQTGLRLYSMRFCPYAQRTRLVLAAKGIEYETCNVHLRDKPEWFHEVSPDLKVPALELPCGKVVWESLICSDLLDEMFPDKNPLSSKDPYERASDKLLLTVLDKAISLYYKVLRKISEESDVDALKKYLMNIEELLMKRKSKFYRGDSPGMVDYMIYPFMRKMFYMDPLTVPSLCQWLDDMNKDPAVIETNYPVEMLEKFYQGYLKGEPDYLLGSDEKP